MIYTFTTLPKQEIVLDYIRMRVNAERILQKPPLSVFPDNNSFLQNALTSIFKGYKNLLNEDELQAIRLKWDSLTDDQKQDIKNIVG